MKELIKKYAAVKFQAIELMRMGKINAYLVKLQEVNDLKLQIVQMRA